MKPSAFLLTAPPYRLRSLVLVLATIAHSQRTLSISLHLSRSAMAALILGAPAIAPQSLNLSSRFSFSQSETLAVSFDTRFVSLSISATSPPIPSVYCGRGDKKTAKGKRFNHSFGNARPRNKKKGRGPPRAPIPPSPPKKDRFEDDEVVKIEIDESLFN
ncbi:30S ribosomal protein S31, chloroplastic [Vitis vinifera]|uniref:30S ribosomal protein S31, chloroplastic n=2 Tax=Vitis vinifera TaxID=29760 RepID=A0A438JAI4_VITVI|nr:30S ribosomal protein S31, chloroplastic [Vitis vinifera]